MGAGAGAVVGVGDFLAMEAPGLLVDDIRTFVRKLR
jgi:hypothetical protein